MFSDVIKAALEAEVAGQPRAINSVVQGVTRAVSGLVPPGGPVCAYMFMGPSGTGKTHLVHTLAKALHGDERRLVVADCTHLAHGDPWLTFMAQLAPLFTVPQAENKWAVLETPPLSIILIEYLERGRAEIVKALAAALETGRVILPEGRQGSLRHCLVFLTSALCAREILDEGPRIGFSATKDEEENERTRLYKLCTAAAQKQYGTDLVARLDDLIVFHRLQEDHLAGILERLVRNLNAWLGPRGFRSELLPEARAFLLERGRRQLQTGARELLRAHRRFVEFPVGDLAITGRIPPGGLILVDHHPDEDHLHFTIQDRQESHAEPARFETGREIPIVWAEGEGIQEAPGLLH